VLMARGRVVMPEHFPAQASSSNGDAHELEVDLLALPFHKSIAELEKRLIRKVLKDSAGNKSEAANRLQINRRLLYNKMEEHKIEE
jgi:DNA-binding NtrC family response regulator